MTRESRTLRDGVMPTDDVCILVVELSVADRINPMSRILRHVPDVDGLRHDLKLAVKPILIILPNHRNK